MAKSSKAIAYKEIRNRIINGHLKPGQPVTEEGLSRELHMSRTPIREALIRLQFEDLVHITDNKGATVVEITPVDIAEIFQLRLLVEPYAARTCAEFINKRRLEKMRDELEKSTRSGLSITASGDPGASLYDIHELHHLIIQAAGNRRLAKWLNTLQSQILWTLNLERRIPGRIERSIAEHLSIVNALLAGDGVQAEESMREHLESNMADLLDVRNYKYLFQPSESVN